MKLSERINAAQAKAQPTAQPAAAKASAPAPAKPRPEGTAQRVQWFEHATEQRTTTAPRPAAAVATAHIPQEETRPKPSQPVDVFAALKQRAATALFEHLGARFNDSAITEQELKAAARDELTRIIDAEQVPLSPEERTRLVQDVADDVLGYGPLQRLLDDPAVTEIMVNRMDQIYVERKGHLTLADSRFSSEEHLRKVIERIVSKVGRRIDESSPLVDARLEDGSRVNAVIRPLAVGGSSLTLRK